MFIALSVQNTFAQGKEHLKTKKVVLDFENCLLEDKGYRQIVISVPTGLKKRKLKDYHGYCEYHLKYKDGSVIFVSTNIYSGASVNIENRMLIGIDTYAKSRSIELVDTIKNTGQQKDGRYWLEYILGDVVVGYVNASIARRESYDKAISTLRRD